MWDDLDWKRNCLKYVKANVSGWNLVGVAQWVEQGINTAKVDSPWRYPVAIFQNCLIENIATKVSSGQLLFPI